MSNENLPKRIIWAIDPHTRKEGLIGLTAKTLKVFTNGIEACIQPLYVLSPLPIVESESPLMSQMAAKWLESASMQAEKALKKINLKGLENPHVVLEPATSTMGLVHALLANAAKYNADLICLATHGRKGFSRAFLGSFAETLIIESNLPLLVVPSHAATPLKIKRILYPTDFTKNSLKAFEKVLELAVTQKAEITLFHHVRRPLEAAIQSSVLLLGGGWVALDQYYVSQSEERTEQSKTWIELAKSKNVKCTFVLSETTDPISDSILKLAKKMKVDLIAMFSERGILTAPLFGSVTRQVIRSSSLPIWALHKKVLERHS